MGGPQKSRNPFEKQVELAAQGKGKYPAECTPILICQHMSWSWQDYLATPAHIIDDILVMIMKDSAARKAEQKAAEAEARAAARRATRR